MGPLDSIPGKIVFFHASAPSVQTSMPDLILGNSSKRFSGVTSTLEPSEFIALSLGKNL